MYFLFACVETSQLCAHYCLRTAVTKVQYTEPSEMVLRSKRSNFVGKAIQYRHWICCVMFNWLSFLNTRDHDLLCSYRMRMGDTFSAVIGIAVPFQSYIWQRSSCLQSNSTLVYPAWAGGVEPWKHANHVGDRRCWKYKDMRTSLRKHNEFIESLQNNAFLHLSSDRSSYVPKVGPTYSMILYFQWKF